MADGTPDEAQAQARAEAKRLAQRANRLMAHWQDESEIEQAFALSNRATKLDPHNVQAWVVLGEALVEFEDFAGAAHAFEHAQALGARSARLWHGLGLAYTELPGHEEQARAAFERLIALKPTDAYALHHFAEALAKAGWKGRPELLEQSAKLLARAVELEPEDSYHGGGLAAVLYKLGRYEAALAAYEDLIARFPSEGNAWQTAPHRRGLFGRAAALGQLGRTEEALAALDGLPLTLPERRSWWVYKAELLNRLGRHAEALEVLKSCLRPSKYHADINAHGWEVKAATLRALGRTAEAEEAECVARTKPLNLSLDDVLYHWTF